MKVSTKPRPTIGPDSRPFWDACAAHRIDLPFCEDCGKPHLPAGPVCPFCLSRKIEWRTASGRGKVATWTMIRRGLHPAFRDEVPYNVAQIELDEGPRLTANVVGLNGVAPVIGMRVEAVFDDIDDTLTMPRFKPI